MTRRLLIVSHTEHYLRDGVVVGWGPTVREIDQLAELFDEVTHVAFLHPDPAPKSAIPYQSPRVHLRPLPPAGGGRLADKLNILARYPEYLRTLLSEMRRADVVHVRAPANVSLLAMVALAFERAPRLRWIKYAGNWQPNGREPLSYRFQRWWLRHNFARSEVTVNGSWLRQPEHIHSFINPCLTDAELDRGEAAAASKEMQPPVRLLYAGRVEAAKGVDEAIRVAADLKKRGIAFHFDVIGDGPDLPTFEQLAAEMGIGGDVQFHGWLARVELDRLYSQAHLLLFLSRASEGWPKVISEAMAFGVVPITSRVSSVPQYIDKFGAGRALDLTDRQAVVDVVVWYTTHPAQWRAEALKSREAAQRFSYRCYLDDVKILLEPVWQI